MKFLVVGAGAIGGYFGGRIVQHGGDATFLVRPRRAAQLTERGLHIRSPHGDHSGPVATIRAEDLDEKQTFDVVVIACKAYDLPGVVDELAPRLGAMTNVLPLLNGVAHYDLLDRRFGHERVLGGLCHIGVTLSAEGDIVHMNDVQHLAFGLRRPEQHAFCNRLAAALRSGSFDLKHSDDIMQDAWEKFAMLAAYAGMTCLMQAPIGVILEAPGGEGLLLAAFDECCRVAAGAGYAPRAAFCEQTEALFSKRGSTGTSSMLRDMQRGARTEADHILGDMLARATELGIEAPLLRTSFARLKCYEQSRSAPPQAADRS